MTTSGGAELLQALELSLSLSEVRGERCGLQAADAAVDAPGRVRASVLRASQTSRRDESIVEPVRVVREHRPHAGLSTSLVQDVHAVTPAVTAGNTGLRVQAHSHATQLAELAHGRLRTGERRADAHSDGQSAVHSAVSAASRRGKASGLEGEDLVLRKLLLVERLLLLLEGFDLGLNGNLRRI